jgi:hypothetical protein
MCTVRAKKVRRALISAQLYSRAGGIGLSSLFAAVYIMGLGASAPQFVISPELAVLNVTARGHRPLQISLVQSQLKAEHFKVATACSWTPRRIF